MKHDAHVADEDLIRAIDGELERVRVTEVQAHLEHCWRCRVRRGELEKAVADFVSLQRATLDSRIPSGEGPAARLRAHLAEMANRPSGAAPAGSFAAKRSVALALAFAAVVASALWLSERGVSAAYRPNAKLTPGATKAISVDQVCGVLEDEETVVSRELATRVFRQYRIQQPRPRTYEVDYLITPALGGADDIRNLWPQPYDDGEWNARVKDALEDYLQAQVCSGKLDLATAQHEIASDWIAAYRKYFHTRHPLPAHSQFVKDRPWE